MTWIPSPEVVRDALRFARDPLLIPWGLASRASLEYAKRRHERRSFGDATTMGALLLMSREWAADQDEAHEDDGRYDDGDDDPQDGVAPVIRRTLDLSGSKHKSEHLASYQIDHGSLVTIAQASSPRCLHLAIGEENSLDIALQRNGEC
jgi:hypothetical protein